MADGGSQRTSVKKCLKQIQRQMEYQNRVSKPKHSGSITAELLGQAVELLGQAAEEIENVYGRETELTETIKGSL